MATLLLVSAALAGEARPLGAPRPVEPGRTEPSLGARRAASLLLVGAAARQGALRVQRGPPPPLRSILGHRAEAALVDEPAPGRVQLILRAATLLLIFTPAVMLVPLALVWGAFRRRVWYPLVTSALATAGTAFIKWGQWASCRPDMFAESLCASLSRLHSQAPTHGFAHTRAEVEAAVGAPISRYFDSFDETPVASGSIAQIHAAVLNGTAVAVKVRHPRVVRRIVHDFTLMRAAAEFSSRFDATRWLNLKASVAQFSETMVAQTRLDIEAEHLRRFAWNFAEAGWRDVSFPSTHLGTRAVLIESFEPGTLVSKFTIERSLGMRSGYELPRDLAHFIVSRGEDVYLKMLLADNLMHADLHPGNILLCAGGLGGAAGEPTGVLPRIAVIDLGMVARLTDDESSAFIGLLNAMGAGDGAAAARAVLRFSSAQAECADPDGFVREMRALFATRCRGFGTGIDFGDVLRGVLSLVREYRVTIDANYMTLVTNVLCLEGMAATLLPGYNVLDAARPLLVAHRRLPRPIFRRVVPLFAAIKRAQDRRSLRRAQREAAAGEGPRRAELRAARAEAGRASRT